MSSCPHVAAAFLQPPRHGQTVYREECTQCFDSQVSSIKFHVGQGLTSPKDSELGIDVCLSCFNAGCVNEERHHAVSHFQKTQHPIVLNVKRIPKPKAAPRDEEPPTKISKLAIQAESDEDKYDFHTTVKCIACGGVEIERTQGNLPAVIDGVMTAVPFSRQSEVQAWEEEIVSCTHTETLQQVPAFKVESQTLAHCAKCELNENLWLCLTCGSLGCGRKQFGGVPGGNGHGLEHTEVTQHPVAVKLGTITPEGSADIYCYACNDARLDPKLADHLHNFGINVASQQKTEKSMTELQIEQNMKFDFSMTTADGKQLEPVFGSGYTGLRNLGNSCYLASVTQSLFSLDPFIKRYGSTAQEHTTHCLLDPATCLQCQLSKVADGLLSGRYSQPVKAEDNETPRSQNGVAPAMFKALVGKGHPEFSTMRQQDAFEFYQHLVKMIEQKEHANAVNDPTQFLKFSTEQRLQCQECKRVRYRSDVQANLSVPVAKKVIQEAIGDEKAQYEPVSLESCLDGAMTDEAIADYECPHCAKTTNALTTTRFETFPDVLVVHARRFELVNWVPTKLEIPLEIPTETSLDKYLGKGLQEGEELLPEDTPAATSSNAPEVNETAVAQLESMGFPRVRCEKALLATGNNGAEVAMNWLLEHMDDPDIDVPMASAGSGASTAGPSSEQISMLADMGFNEGQAKKALKETGGDMERAVEWLFSHPDVTGDEADDEAVPTTQKFGNSSLPAKYTLKSFISHKGSSVHAGHYVSHIQKDGQWVLYNDEKVVKADDVEDLQSKAYIYIFVRA